MRFAGIARILDLGRLVEEADAGRDRLVAERAALCSAAKPTEKAALVEEVKAGCGARLAHPETFQADVTLGLWPFRDVPQQPPPLRRADSCQLAVQPVHLAV